MNAGYRAASAVALALLMACERPTEAPPEIRTTAFQQFVQRLGEESPCSREIPLTWSPSLPIPVLVDHRLHYRVFFSGWHGRPDTEIVLHDAEGDALFSAEGRVLECRRRAVIGRPLPEEPPMVITVDELQARLPALYDAIEKFGRLYAQGNAVTEADRAQLRAFPREFSALTVRGHAASYRALNPAFWAWLQRNSKPKTQ